MAFPFAGIVYTALAVSWVLLPLSTALAQLPDLAVAVLAPQSPVPSNAQTAFTVWVENRALLQRYCYYDRERKPPRVCEWEDVGPTATNVELNITVSGGSIVQISPNGFNGFACPGSTGQCSGGTLASGDRAAIVVTVQASTGPATLSLTARVNPNRQPAERLWTNNVSMRSVTVSGPPAPRPDLWPVCVANPSTTQAGQHVTFDITVHNLGQVDAQNVSLLLSTNLPARFSGLNTTAGFACYMPSGYFPRFGMQCDGGTVPHQSTATMSVTLSFSVTGPNVLALFADPNNTLTEMDEMNNLTNCTVVVQ